MQNLVLYLLNTNWRGRHGRALGWRGSQLGTLPNQLVWTCWLLLKYDPERWLHARVFCLGNGVGEGNASEACFILHCVLRVLEIRSGLIQTRLHFMVNRLSKQAGSVPSPSPAFKMKIQTIYLLTVWVRLFFFLFKVSIKQNTPRACIVKLSWGMDQ